MKTQASLVWLWSSFDMVVALTATWTSLLLAHPSSQAGGVSQVLAVHLSVKNFWLLTIFLVLWTGIHQLSGLYCDLDRNLRGSRMLPAASAAAFGSVFFLLFPLFSNDKATSALVPVAYFLAAALVESLLGRWLLWPLMSQLGGPGPKPARTIIIGSGPLALRTYQARLTNANRGNCLIGFVDDAGAHTVPEAIAPKLLGSFDRLERLLMSTPVDEVIIALPLRSCYDQIQKAIIICERVGVPVTYHFEPFRHTLGFSQIEHRSLQPYISWRPSRIEESTALKRAIDLLASTCALFLLLPLMTATALAIKLTSTGPVFFVQERYGLNKRKFRIYKFRTMVANADSLQPSLESRNEKAGPIFKIKNDPRITPLGRLLRVSSIDELPQLLNVLRGDMSLVGPRPMSVRDVLRFGDASLMRRFSVKPGLTCLWQVSGRSNTDFLQWITLDLKYIDTWSLGLDLQILAKTIPAVLTGKGAA